MAQVECACLESVRPEFKSAKKKPTSTNKRILEKAMCIISYQQTYNDCTTLTLITESLLYARQVEDEHRDKFGGLGNTRKGYRAMCTKGDPASLSQNAPPTLHLHSAPGSQAGLGFAPAPGSVQKSNE
jgi:hypothetical protein